MTAAKTGHSALDAEAGIRGDLANQPDDEVEGAFIAAALAHAEQQYHLLEAQADNIAAKAAEVAEQWQAKADEAVCMREAAADEVDKWQRQLDQRTGF